MVNGQYLNGKNLGCDKIPDSRETEIVLVSPPATPTKLSLKYADVIVPPTTNAGVFINSFP